MDEDLALREIEDQLDRAFSGVSAPEHFSAAVRKRIREQPVSRLPEILDFIGWTAVLAAVCALLIWFAPPSLDRYSVLGVGAAAVASAVWFAVRSTREAAE